MLKACLEPVPQTLPPFPHCHLKVALATGIIQHTLGKVDVVRAHQTIVLLGKNLMKGLGSPRLWELLFFCHRFVGSSGCIHRIWISLAKRLETWQMAL